MRTREEILNSIINFSETITVLAQRIKQSDGLGEYSENIHRRIAGIKRKERQLQRVFSYLGEEINNLS